MSDLRAITERVDIEVPRREFSPAGTMRDGGRPAWLALQDEGVERRRTGPSESPP